MLDAALPGIDYEVVIVDDDSPDSTAALSCSVAQQNPKVRVLHRIGRKGLSSATVEGILSRSSPYVAVMDAGLQHDEKILPAMLQKLKQDDLDIVIGSQYDPWRRNWSGCSTIRSCERNWDAPHGPMPYNITLGEKPRSRCAKPMKAW